MRMVLLLALLILDGARCAAQPVAPIETCDSIIVDQVRASLAELSKARGAHALPGTGAITAVYAGTASVEAHLMRPGMVRTVPVRIEILAEAGGDRVSVREISGAQDSADIETTLVVGAKAAYQPSPKRPFVEESSQAAAGATRWLPITAVSGARPASCRPGPQVVRDGRSFLPITFVDAAGSACTLLIDREDRLDRIESVWAHQRLGDVCEWTQFGEWERRDGASVPRRISRFIVQDAATVRYDLSLVSYDAAPAPAGAFDLPEDHRQDLPEWTQARTSASGMEFAQIAPGLWSIEIAASNSRVLVVERASDLVLLGAPDGDAVCSELAAALAERFSHKPIGVVAFSHHHPSPSGGLRAIAAAGATIMCPRELEPYARSLLSRPTSLGRPAVEAPAQPRLDLFDRTTTIDCGATTVRLIDIAEKSAHAFRYVVFYIPEAGVLFEDDLGYFPANGAVQVGPRLAGLAAALEVEHIEPTRLIPGWPVRGAQREMAWAVIADLVWAQREKQRGK